MRKLSLWLAPLVVLASVSAAQGELLRRLHCGGGGCYGGSSCAPCVGYETVEKTVWAPEWVTEMRTVRHVQCVPEERQKTITVYDRVAETHDVTREYTVVVPQVRTRTVEYPVCRTVWHEKQQEYTVAVPYQEERQGVRQECRWVPVEATRTIMVPDVRTRTVEYQVCKPVWREESREYTVSVPYTEEREGMRQVCEWVPETVTRTVMVPETRTRTVEYTVNRTVWHEKTVEYTVSVPHREERQGVRRVCRWEPYTDVRTYRQDCGRWECVECEVPECGDAGCGSCCVRHYTRRVWVPNVVERQVEVTCRRPVTEEVPYTYWVTVCRPEVRSRTVRVPECVPETMTREQQYVVCVPQQREYTVRRPVTREVPYTYTVTLCRPEVRTRVVRVPDVVHETRTKEVEYTVCVPQQQTYTVQRPETYDVPYTYAVTLCRHETRSRTIRVPEVVRETHSKEVEYTVCVPETRTKTYPVTTWKCVPREKTVTYTVMVPHTVEREVPVRVCRRVPRQVTCRVPVYGCGPSYSCGSGCCP